jgi:Domain of unknown function (DUF4397)
MKFQIGPWRVIMLLAFSVLLLGIPAAASASSSAASTGWIRLGNLTTSPVDAYVYSSGDPSPQIKLPDLTYGEVSSHQVVNAGNYTVKMRSAGSSASSTPVYTTSVTVQAGHSYTVAAVAVANVGGQAMVIDDQLTTPAGKSLVRVIQASLTQRSVNFYCSCGGYITTKAAPGFVSRYQGIPPGRWTMTATGHGAKGSLPVTLTADTVHTEIVLDATGGGIEVVDLLDAAGPGQPPVGGASTGFGGTAPHGPGSPLPWLALIGAGAVLALVYGVRVRGNRLRRPTTGV